MITTQLSQLDDLRSGEVIQHYRLLERIGYGGQATIWSALDEQANQVIAIKFNEPGNADSNEAAAFEQQAKLITSLQHPHILPLYEFSQIGQLRYMAMPYIAAGSLRDLLDMASLSQAEFLRLATQMLSALEHMHQRNIVHRD